MDKVVNCPDTRKCPNFLVQLDARTGMKTRNYICVPILIDKAVRGGIIVTNRVATAEENLKARDPRQSPRGEIPQFGPSDEVLLAFIATNAGLAIKHKISAYKKMSSISTISTSKPIDRLPPSDVEKALQVLADRACLELDAHIISVFAYNDATKRLESTVSNDSKDLSMPIDRGVAGTAFRMGRVINVRETASDERFNRDDDANLECKMQSLLCAPIVDSSGRPVGVIQAINKKGLAHFTRHDETLICEFCSQAFSLLQDVDFLSDGADNYNASLVAKFLAALVSTSDVSSMVKEVKRLVMDAVVCDYVELMSFITDSSGGHLICHSNNELENSVSDRIPLSAIPTEILDALRLGVVTEMSVSTEGSRKKTLASFLPDVKARHALVHPLHGDPRTSGASAQNYTDCEGRTWQCSSVLVVIRNSHSLLPFLAATRELLELFVAVLGTSLDHVANRQLQDAAIASLESNFLLANGTLGTLQDYIVLLDGGGQVIAWNRDLCTLLGPDEDEGVPMDVEDSSSSSGCWMKVRASGGISGSKDEDSSHLGQHFSKWFKMNNSPELITDIAKATASNRSKEPVNIEKSAKLTSPQHPRGVWIDYQLLSLNTEGPPTDDEAGSVVLVVRIKDDAGPPLVRSYSNKRICTYDTLVRSLSETAEARMIIESASAMLGSVGLKFDVTPGILKELNSASKELHDLAHNLDNSSYKSLRTEKMTRGLVNTNVSLPDNLFSWDFNVLDISDKTVLVSVLGRIFESIQLLDGLGIEPLMLANYLRDIADKYHDNPFHNLHHATCVTQFAYMLIHATDAAKYLSPQQFFGVVISAVVHDVDHPGNTNMFEVNSQSYLSLLYNDQSVLENHHCSTAFQLMRKPSSNIFNGLTKATASEMRKTIVTCIMSTDMSVHFQLVDETKKMVAGGDYTFTEVQDQMFLCRLLVHSADLSNPVRPFHITQAWARRISAEFNLQVAMEQELDMPVLNFMMTPDDKALCKNETGFASFVVAPMWRSLSVLFPGLTPLVQQLDSNLLSWKSMLERIMKEEDAERSIA